jgi:hypothetical protein
MASALARPSSLDLPSQLKGEDKASKPEGEDEDEAKLEDEEEEEDKEEDEGPCRQEECSNPAGPCRGLSHKPDKLWLPPEPRREIGYPPSPHTII